jgi:hydroxymethylbilane synthase
MTVELRAATRGSALARWQTDHVAALLGSSLGHDVTVEPVVVQTTADQRLDIPIWEMGGKGVFVKEVQAEVLAGRAHLAVHSGKDLPAVRHPELVVAAVPRRADPRDVLVGSHFADLAPGALIATGSVRRRAQLAWLRPDLTFAGLRGNIATRLDRVPPGGAIIMAAAALERLALYDTLASSGMAYEILEPNLMLPQVAQGSLAVECRADDDEAIAMLATIDDPSSRVAFEAERSFLATLGGDCDLPAGAYATLDRSGDDGAEHVVVEGLLASLDGHTVLRLRRRGDVAGAEAVGRQVARALLDDAGGAALLDR